MSKYAPRREDGLMAYVVTESAWGKRDHWIVWDDSLTSAKAAHGWTQMLYTSRAVRRATPDDVVAYKERA